MSKIISKISTAMNIYGAGGLDALRSATWVKMYGSPIGRALDNLAAQPKISLIQVGAFVGDTENDPIFRFLKNRPPERASTIVLIEPVAEFFEQLCHNYDTIPGVYFENVAVAESAGIREFYRLGVDPVQFGYPDWLSQISSLDPERMNSLWHHYDKNLEYRRFWLDHRVVERVQCTTVMDLIHKYSIDELDLLQIDTEGYDYRILRSIDFSVLRPKYINYERVHLMDSEKPCRIMLRKAGYRLIDHGLDTLAVGTKHF